MNIAAITAHYGEWLADMPDPDWEFVSASHAEVVEICARDPTRPRWLEYLYDWTLAAHDADDPATVLREAVANTDGEPEEIHRAIVAVDKITHEWQARRRRLLSAR